MFWKMLINFEIIVSYNLYYLKRSKDKREVKNSELQEMSYSTGGAKSAQVTSSCLSEEEESHETESI